tara:strand:+ start:4073 stop:4330 length:258 start_codon:yes stop_codon:yes gene_type:complete
LVRLELNISAISHYLAIERFSSLTQEILDKTIINPIFLNLSNVDLKISNFASIPKKNIFSFKKTFKNKFLKKFEISQFNKKYSEI